VGHKEQFMALLIAIEEHHRLEDSNSLTKRRRELRILECSINYDTKGERSSHGKGKHRGLSVFS
jgi:hypothetical protein